MLERIVVSPKRPASPSSDFRVAPGQLTDPAVVDNEPWRVCGVVDKASVGRRNPWEALSTTPQSGVATREVASFLFALREILSHPLRLTFLDFPYGAELSFFSAVCY